MNKDPRGHDTFSQDVINAATPIIDQFPEETIGDGVFDPLQAGFRVVLADRKRYRTVGDAQYYFNQLREAQQWTHQSPIFRTARFWVRRVFP